MSYSLIYKLDSTASLIHKDHITNCDEAVPVFLPCFNHCTQEEGYESFLCAVLSRLVAQSCPTLCNPPWTVADQAPVSMGILQARILEWVTKPSSRGSSQPRGQTQVSHIAERFFTV